MTSLLTNTAAMTALQALTATQRQLSKTQAQISSGLAVAQASDNAAYWSIGQTMSAQVIGLSAVDKGLSLTLSIADVTSAALGSIKTSLDRIQADVVAAQQSGVSLSAVQADISAQQQSIIAVVGSASFNGVNWLTNKVSTSRSITIDAETPVSRQDYLDIGNGLKHDVSTTFDRTETETLTQTDGAARSSYTHTSVYETVLSDDHDGKVTIDRRMISSTTAVTNNNVKIDSVTVPVSLSSANGLIVGSFSLIPLTLFSDLTGSDDVTTTVSFDHVVDADYSSHYGPVPTYDTRSYDGYGAGASQGILDGVVYLPGKATGAVPSGPASSSPPSVTQSSFQFDLTGGAQVTTQQGPSSGGGAVGTTGQWIREAILTMDITNASNADLNAIGTMVQAALTGIIGASTAVGSLRTQITNQQAYNAALTDALTSGIGSLVDADMNVASTRLQALQTQQQLGIQALSIANQNGQLILKLFQAA